MNEISRRSFMAGALALPAIKYLPKRRTGFVPTKIVSYGHSFTMGPTSPTGPYPYANNPYAGVVASHYGAVVDYKGRSGTRLLDTVRGIVAPQFAGYDPNFRIWTPSGNNGNSAVLLQNGHNDESSAVGSDPAYIEGYTGALRLALGVFGARSRILPDSADFMSAGWTKRDYPDRAPNGAMWYTKTYSDKMDFTISGSTATIATAAIDSSYGVYGTMKIYVNDVLWTIVDGSDSGYYHGTGKMKSYIDSIDGVTTVAWSPYGIRITGMPAGYNKLTIRKVDDTTNPIWISAVYQPTGSPPKVFVALEPLRNPDALDQGNYNNFVANDPTYRALITDMCNKYTFAHVVDLAPGWDNPTMVAYADPDGTGPLKADPYRFHPNHAGMNFIANKFIAAIDAA